MQIKEPRPAFNQFFSPQNSANKIYKIAPPTIMPKEPAMKGKITNNVIAAKRVKKVWRCSLFLKSKTSNFSLLS